MGRTPIVRVLWKDGTDRIERERRKRGGKEVRGPERKKS